jgi:putative protease
MLPSKKEVWISKMAEKKIGKITHFFDNISVGIIELEDEIKIGDKVKFQGATTDFEQEITSMQYDHNDIESAGKGQEVGIKTDEKVREGDEVYIVE